MQKFPTLTTQQVYESLTIPNIRILDIRPVDYYNGWPQENATRGGHIPHAKSLPEKWSHYIDWIEIVRNKRILPEHKIIIYGLEEEVLLRIANLFYKAGYPSIYLYHDFASKWLSDVNYPLDKLSRYKHLVPSWWLSQALEKQASGAFRQLVVCHAHYQNPSDYEKGHIPGAIALDTNWLESEETWNRRTPEELAEVLARIGITQQSTVVLYGRFNYPRNDDPFPGSSAGHLGAIRCAAILLYAGVNHVKILNGGIQSWEDDGYPISTTNVVPKSAEAFGAPIPGRPDVFIDTPEAKEILATPGQKLVSIRSWEEFIGKVSGYNYIEKTGRIPGATFGNCGTDAYHMENYRNLDHTTREAQEIEAMLAKEEIFPEQRLAFYCGTGWRGSEAFFNAWLMGWPQIAIYDGGWFEWSNDPANPIETGIPQLRTHA
ncbi:MAG: sulfurtransferase [Bacteroidota bacterium]